MKRQTILITLLNYILVSLVYYLLVHFDFFKISPPKASLLLMDAYWYDQMRSFGYKYIPNAMCNLAFFPLFPFIWKITHLGPIGISILNGLIFTFSIAYLIDKEKYPLWYKLMLVSFPNFVFFVVPYSEAIFFLFGTVILIGYRKNSQLMICLGIFGSGLVRSVSIFFIPAIIITEFIDYYYSPSKTTKAKHALNVLLYSLTSGLSFFIVSFYQKISTGKWFYFLQVQKYWGREFQNISFPITTKSAARILGIDCIAMVIGILAIYILSKAVVNIFIKFRDRSPTSSLERPVVFSALYLSSIVFLDLFFTNTIDGKTSIWSMNRHIMCSPYFICFLNYMYFQFQMYKLDRFVILFLILFGALATELFEYKLNFLYYLSFFMTLMILPMYAKMEKLNTSNTLPLTALYIFNIVLFLFFYQSYLLNYWIG